MPHRPMIAAVLVFVLSASALPSQDEPKDLDKLQGDWAVTAMETNGKPVPLGVSKISGLVTFKGDLMVVAGLGPKPSEHRIKLNPSQKPKSLDATNKGDGKLCIYQLEGDKLKFCMPIGTRTKRPTAFKSAEDSNLVVMTLKRSKK